MIDESPDIAELRSRVAAITASLDEYESTVDPLQRSSILSNVAQDSQHIKAACTPASDAFTDFTFQPLGNTCVRIALSMNLFDCIPRDRSISVEELAKLYNADLDLTKRIARGLVALSILDLEDSSEKFSHTSMSLIYTDPARRSWAIWMFDVMAQGAAAGVGPYFESHGKPFANPVDSKNSPFTMAHNAKDTSIFDIIKSIGKLPLLNSAMSGSSVQCAKEAVASFDFGSLHTPESGVVLVDVGGAKGQTIKEIRRAYPKLKGKTVLEDLQSVLDDGVSPDLESELVPYDFFKEEQPVKGAAAYLYQRIFHDWSDEDCLKILASLRPAMGPISKLLVCDVVVQDRRPPPRKVLRDMNMLLVGGMERSQQQWTYLLETAGFRVASFHGLQNSDNSIIEAHLI